MGDGYAQFQDLAAQQAVDGRLIVGTGAGPGPSGPEPQPQGTREPEPEAADVGTDLTALYDRDNWPPCRCGSTRCPDYVEPPPAAASPPGGKLRADLAELNRRSSRGGV